MPFRQDRQPEPTIKSTFSTRPLGSGFPIHVMTKERLKIAHKMNNISIIDRPMGSADGERSGRVRDVGGSFGFGHREHWRLLRLRKIGRCTTTTGSRNEPRHRHRRTRLHFGRPVGIWKWNDQLLGKHWSHRHHQSKSFSSNERKH